MCAVQVAAQAAQHFRDHAISAALVDGVDFLQKRHSFLHTQLFGAGDKSANVFGQAATTESDASAQETMPNACVIPQGFRQLGHIPAGGFA